MRRKLAAGVLVIVILSSCTSIPYLQRVRLGLPGAVGLVLAQTDDSICVLVDDGSTQSYQVAESQRIRLAKSDLLGNRVQIYLRDDLVAGWDKIETVKLRSLPAVDSNTCTPLATVESVQPASESLLGSSGLLDIIRSLIDRCLSGSSQLESSNVTGACAMLGSAIENSQRCPASVRDNLVAITEIVCKP